MDINEVVETINKLEAAGYIVAIFRPHDTQWIIDSEEVEEAMIAAGQKFIASNHRKDSNND